ncbi:MAG: hypothetical protein ACRD12_05135 [Acidimicrobiales bacterium]
MRLGVLAALAWEPQIKGALYVIVAVLVLCGSCYMILATNTGARLGFLLAAAGMFGWLFTGGVIWWVYGQGPKGPAPSWEVVTVVVGSPSSSGASVLTGFPRKWEELEVTDKAVADATPVVDGAIVGSGKQFKSPSEFQVTGAFDRGGDAHGILGLNFRPVNLWHTPHYLMITVQKTLPAVGGQKPAVDPSAPPVSVVLIRNQGALRLHPAVFTISTGIIFGVVCYQLHSRDKDLWRKREEESGKTLEPV